MHICLGIVLFLYSQAMYSITSSSQIAYISVALLIIGFIAVKNAVKIMNRRKISFSSFYEIDNMSGTEFEKYLQVKFEEQNYKVEHIGQTGDFGADLILHKGKKKVVVQAKRYSGNVGIKAVQEVVAAKQFYDCSHAMVVTNSFFTAAAKELANRCNVNLVDRNYLQKRFQITKK